MKTQIIIPDNPEADYSTNENLLDALDDLLEKPTKPKP